MMKNISSKKLKIIQALSWLLSLVMIALAYFRLLDKNICFCAMLVFFAIGVVVEFIMRDRKIKEYKGKDDKWSKIKSFGIISSNVWFLLVVVLMIVVLLIKAID